MTNDLMRPPLGILTGVGFIGGRAVLRRGSLIVGVTTAATLSYVTVVGLCFGGGQMLLGWLATAIGVFVLWGLRWFENFMSVEQHALFALTLETDGPSESGSGASLKRQRLPFSTSTSGPALAPGH